MPYYDCIWGRKGRFVCEYWIIMANSKLLLGTLEALCVCVLFAFQANATFILPKKGYPTRRAVSSEFPTPVRGVLQDVAKA